MVWEAFQIYALNLLWRLRDARHGAQLSIVNDNLYVSTLYVSVTVFWQLFGIVPGTKACLWIMTMVRCTAIPWSLLSL